MAIDGEDEIPPVDQPIETQQNEARIRRNRERKQRRAEARRRRGEKESVSNSEPTTEELESMESDDL